MKITRYFFIAASLLTMLTACDSDLEKITFNPENAAPGQLTASETSIELTAAKTKQEVLTLKWGKSEYGLPVAVSYTVQMDVRGGDFSNAYTLASTSDNTVTFKGNELNKAILALQLLKNPDADYNYDPQELDFRVTSDFSEDVATIYTNKLGITITPYAGKMEYRKLAVPGSHQGWAPDNYGQALYETDAKNHPNVFVGYVYMGAGTEFKFADGSWDVNWGSSDGATLEEGGSNISVPGAGCYYLSVNLNDLTFTMEKRDWSIVGDAVGGWDNDIDLEFDKDNNVFRTTYNFTGEGEFKFRVNHAWDINLGADADGDEGDLKEGGANIKPLPGEYTVTLSFADGYPVYKLFAGSDVSKVKYASLPGSMNGWSADTKANILVLSGGTYSGWLYCTADDEFKITLGSWADADCFGWNADKNALEQPGANLKPGEGMYFITADLDAMTVSLARHNWSIVGSAVGGDTNWNTDYDLTWNPETKMLEGTFELADGEMKFRADHDWGLNYGGADGNLQKDGANIPIAAGTYFIQLDLQTTYDHLDPTYTITAK
jgi:hypothetical protein